MRRSGLVSATEVECRARRFHQRKTFAGHVPHSRPRQQGHRTCPCKTFPGAWHHRLASPPEHFGKPDFTFRRERVVVFVDGCFWHGCPKHSNLPVNNRPFWRKKLAANSLRDRLVTRTLRRQGWRVLRIWEHDLTTKGTSIARKIKRLMGLSYHFSFTAPARTKPGDLETFLKSR